MFKHQVVEGYLKVVVGRGFKTRWWWVFNLGGEGSLNKVVRGNQIRWWWIMKLGGGGGGESQ